MEKQLKHISEPALLKLLFIHYLNRIYHGKKYLDKHLPGVIDASHSNTLKFAIEELLEDVKKQINRMDEIYDLLETKPVEEIDSPIKTIIMEACHTDPANSNKDVINDLDLMVHMQLVEHVNIISYRMLSLIAQKLDYKQIEQMMQECFDESQDDDSLFLSISNEYLEGK